MTTYRKSIRHERPSKFPHQFYRRLIFKRADIQFADCTLLPFQLALTFNFFALLTQLRDIRG